MQASGREFLQVSPKPTPPLSSMEPEPITHETDGANFRTLSENYKRLRYLFHSVSISLLILTGVVFVFILRQVVMIRQQTEQLSAEVVEFQESGVPQAIDRLRKDLYTFSQENEDFRPIFVRYFGTNAPAPQSPIMRPGGTSEGPTP